MPARKPPRLRPGGRIGVIAPAGCVDGDVLAAGVEAIRREGFQVELAPNITERKGYLAGDERDRAKSLEDFFRRPDIGSIFCARGGFGSVQIVPYVNCSITSNPKIFVGYSDITVLLNWFLQQCAMVTFHAPMVAMDLARGLEGRSKEQFWGTLTGTLTTWRTRLGEVIRPGRAEAEMMGGCLSLLVTTLGTAFEIHPEGKILLLEDVGEKPYRIERMLTHLKMAGKLENLAGLVFGDFTDCEGDESRDVWQIVRELFCHASYPVLTGLSVGHGPENLTVPFGVKLCLDASSRTLSLLEPPVL